ncbi:hypothetical protein L6164_023946 [Bauhinia variegata]|uniref:Uncharacterized protein n=1 Tax=Bauhinia variegata TaxID=167791 RepID=A0ACB9LXE2_BAUVA|nr:hypothetical protein L6164_023946 [Bauhinia variegata]
MPTYVKFMKDILTNKRNLKETEKCTTTRIKASTSSFEICFLREGDTYHVIISASLTPLDEEKLLRIFRQHKGAIEWTIEDIKGVNPTICTHKFLLEEGHKHVM